MSPLDSLRGTPDPTRVLVAPTTLGPDDRPTYDDPSLTFDEPDRWSYDS